MTDRAARIAKMSADDPTLDTRFEKAEQVGGRLFQPDNESGTPAEIPANESGTPAEIPAKKKPALEKVVRDAFSMPASDHRLITELRVLMTRSDGTQLNKSEVVRAALRAFRRLPDAEIRRAAAEIESLTRRD